MRQRFLVIPRRTEAAFPPPTCPRFDDNCAQRDAGEPTLLQRGRAQPPAAVRALGVEEPHLEEGVAVGGRRQLREELGRQGGRGGSPAAAGVRARAARGANGRDRRRGGDSPAATPPARPKRASSAAILFGVLGATVRGTGSSRVRLSTDSRGTKRIPTSPKPTAGPQYSPFSWCTGKPWLLKA